MIPAYHGYDPRPADKRSSRAVFHHECSPQKQKILEITGFFEDLTENGYIRRIYRGLRGRMELPMHYDRVWRKYSDFYSAIMAGLGFVCLADFVPKLKLYKLWEALKSAALQPVPRVGWADPLFLKPLANLHGFPGAFFAFFRPRSGSRGVSGIRAVPPFTFFRNMVYQFG
ncbi:MAG: hypothetical protein LBP88_08695 [Treponema sp.]|nr:hypothetical protein [Treponema sp.]